MFDFFFADRMRSITTSTGEYGLTLTAGTGPWAPITYAAVGDKRIFYTIVHENGTEWEVGYASMNSGNVMSGRVALASSNAGAVVDFSAGEKEVFVTFPASVAAAANSVCIGKGRAGPGEVSSVVTSNAVATALYISNFLGSGLPTVPDDGLIEITVCARKPDNSQLKTWKITVCAEPGSSVYSGKTVTVVTDKGAPSWTVDVDSSGTLQVTGAAATTVNWAAFARLDGYFV